MYHNAGTANRYIRKLNKKKNLVYYVVEHRSLTIDSNNRYSGKIIHTLLILLRSFFFFFQRIAVVNAWLAFGFRILYYF